MYRSRILQRRETSWCPMIATTKDECKRKEYTCPHFLLPVTLGTSQCLLKFSNGTRLCSSHRCLSGGQDFPRLLFLSHHTLVHLALLTKTFFILPFCRRKNNQQPYMGNSETIDHLEWTWDPPYWVFTDSLCSIKKEWSLSSITWRVIASPPIIKYSSTKEKQQLDLITGYFRN